MELKNYETVFILTPLLNETQMQETVEKFRQVLKENSADIITSAKQEPIVTTLSLSLRSRIASGIVTSVRNIG